MWHYLKPADIEQAKRDLDRRRAGTLSRHAQERDALDAEAADVEQLLRLAESFSRKFATTPPVSPIAAPEPAPFAITTSRVVPSSWPAEAGDYPRTNFDVFSRAVSKATF